MVSLRSVPEGMAQPEALSGFEHIRRYWDRMHNSFAAKILPGEFYVTCADEAVITSLGSCVSACIRDRIYGIGGMNHFMLPEAADRDAGQSVDLTEAARYGSYAMEQLVNEILKAGGRRENLEVKLVGGGQVIASMKSDVGRRNIQFAKDYIANDGMTITGSDLGGDMPRRVVYFPATGKVRVKKLRSQEVFEQESAYKDRISHQHIEGAVELF